MPGYPNIASTPPGSFASFGCSSLKVAMLFCTLGKVTFAISQVLQNSSNLLFVVMLAIYTKVHFSVILYVLKNTYFV